jgi:hypothetical protein
LRVKYIKCTIIQSQLAVNQLLLATTNATKHQQHRFVVTAPTTTNVVSKAFRYVSQHVVVGVDADVKHKNADSTSHNAEDANKNQLAVDHAVSKVPPLDNLMMLDALEIDVTRTTDGTQETYMVQAAAVDTQTIDHAEEPTVSVESIEVKTSASNSRTTAAHKNAQAILAKPPTVSVDANKSKTFASVVKGQLASANVTRSKLSTGNLADAMIITSMIAEAILIARMIAEAMIITSMIADAMIITRMIADAMIITRMIADAMIITRMIADAMIIIRMITDAIVIPAMMTVDAILKARMTADATIIKSRTTDALSLQLGAVDAFSHQHGDVKALNHQPMIAEALSYQTMIVDALSHQRLTADVTSHSADAFRRSVTHATYVINQQSAADAKSNAFNATNLRTNANADTNIE